MPKVRNAAWSGTFYPDEPKNLTKMIEKYLAKAKDLTLPSPSGLVTPHAGYEYSGQTAAAAYKQILGRSFDTVIVIAPSHAEMIKGISVYDGNYYETPLGKIALDKECIQTLQQSSTLIQLTEAGHRTTGQRAEHSLEVQLPFLQVVLESNFKLVPIMLYDFSLENCQSLGNALADYMKNKRVLLVASSDLYHGYSLDECIQTDNYTIEQIKSMNPAQFLKNIESGAAQACGAGPIASLMFAFNRLNIEHVKLIEQTNSADITNSVGGWTVGYASIVFY